MPDGLSTQLGELGSESILDLGVSTADLAPTSVTAAKLGVESVTASKQKFLGTGSPTVFGNSGQSGDFVSNAGSVAVVQFGTAFEAAPFVVANAAGGIASIPAASAGSVVIESTDASVSGTWIAIGSGALYKPHLFFIFFLASPKSNTPQWIRRNNARNTRIFRKR